MTIRSSDYRKRHKPNAVMPKVVIGKYFAIKSQMMRNSILVSLVLFCTSLGAQDSTQYSLDYFGVNFNGSKIASFETKQFPKIYKNASVYRGLLILSFDDQQLLNNHKDSAIVLLRNNYPAELWDVSVGYNQNNNLLTVGKVTGTYEVSSQLQPVTNSKASSVKAGGILIAVAGTGFIANLIRTSGDLDNVNDLDKFNRTTRFIEAISSLFLVSGGLVIAF